MNPNQPTASALIRSRLAAPLCCVALAFACNAQPETEPAGPTAVAGSPDAESHGDSFAGAPPATDQPQPTWPGRLAPTAETAQALFDRVLSLYQGHAAAAYPAGTHQLSIQLLSGKDVHAGSVARRWEVSASLGLIERKQMTVDILATFVCHEMGHIVGGYPFKLDQNAHVDGTGAASEGQADYFATKDCLPRLWAAEQAENAAAASLLGESERARCAATYPDETSRALCGRILLTSLATSHIFKEEREGENVPYPAFDTPDGSRPAESVRGYTASQCRLDTFVAGALCNVKAVGTDVPGFLPPYDDFSEAYEVAARPFACQEGPGARPRCWFVPDRRAFDCSATPPYCAIDEQGYAVGRSCTTGGGPALSSCEAGLVCEIDERGNFNCVEGPPLPPGEAPEEMP
jgi:hypothetical protein